MVYSYIFPLLLLSLLLGESGAKGAITATAAYSTKTATTPKSCNLKIEKCKK